MLIAVQVCEFGACGDIGFGFQQGSGSNYPFTFWKSVGELAGMYDFYSNLGDVGKYPANAHQVTYEDWCGPGGSGPNLSGHDAACHVPDVCYDTNGLHVLDNFNPTLPANKASALEECNQQPCNATRGSLVDTSISPVLVRRSEGGADEGRPEIRVLQCDLPIRGLQLLLARGDDVLVREE